MNTTTELRWALSLMAEKGDESAPSQIVTLSKAMAANSPVLYSRLLTAWRNCMSQAELTRDEQIRFAALLEMLEPETSEMSDKFNMRLDEDDKRHLRAIRRRTGESLSDIVSRLLREECARNT